MKKPNETKKIPDEIVTERIMKSLVEKGLLSTGRVDKLRDHFIAGTLDIEEAERLFEFDPKEGRST